MGSINLSEFVNDPFTDLASFDYDELKQTVRTCVKALNDILDDGLPLHPLQEQRDSVRDWRQIGLGVMGLADCLLKLGYKYGEEDCLEFCNKLGYTIACESIWMSAHLASQKGVYPKYKTCIMNSPYFIENTDSDAKEYVKTNGLRNSQLLTTAPTGTLSTMLGISGGMEPIYANYYTRKTESLYGEPVYYKVYTPIVQKYMEMHNISDDKDLPDYFITAMDLDYHKRIKMQAVWQKHIDASISSTVNLPESATIEDVENLYLEAWKNGLKGVTIYRDQCKRSGVLSTATTEESQESALARGYVISASDDLVGKKRKLITGCGSLHCIAMFDKETGELRETYLSKGSTGGCQNFMIGLSRMISIAARGGISIADIVDQLYSTGTCPSYAIRKATKNDTSKGSCCPVAVGNALMDMYNEMQSEIRHIGPMTSENRNETSSSKSTTTVSDNFEVSVSISSEAVCPECGEPIVFEGGCNTCKNCGWSKCN